MTTATTPSTEFGIDGHAGHLVARHWEADAPTYVALLCHGYGEHVRRYEEVATGWPGQGRPSTGSITRARTQRWGAGAGRGLREGRRRRTPGRGHRRAEHPDLPVVLIGHSMGGMIGARYAQRYGAELAGVVLSGPVLGPGTRSTAMLAAEEIPDVPIDPGSVVPGRGRGPGVRRGSAGLARALQTADAGGPAACDRHRRRGRPGHRSAPAVAARRGRPAGPDRPVSRGGSRRSPRPEQPRRSTRVPATRSSTRRTRTRCSPTCSPSCTPTSQRENRDIP